MNIRHLEGNNPHALGIINHIVDIINNADLKNNSYIFYIGHDQYAALMSIEPNDMFGIKDDRLMGIKIVRVCDSNYTHLAQLS